MAREISSIPSFMPPVSIKVIFEFFKLPYCLSLVRPEKSATIADLEPVRILNIVDLPTLGRPTIATTDMIFL